ncbi:hypothetical protein STVA_25950 [Allostella vacuolata]|nr:hypothetical protein STVA_25950 [Stella vacuolata]
MAAFVALEALGTPGRGLDALFGGFSVESQSPTEVVLKLSDGSTLAMQGPEFRYSEDGQLAGGTVEAFQLDDGGAPILTADQLDLSAAALLGFLADQRPFDLAAYVFDGDDTIDGSADNDLGDGFDGNDLIHGHDGDDLFLGGDGEDTLEGDAGDDTLRGERGADELLGGDGNDVLFGNLGRDSIDGGPGNDTIFGGQAYDAIHGGDGDDLIYSDLGGDDVWGGSGHDTIHVEGEGDDWIFFEDGSGQDRIDGLDVTSGDLIFLLRNINNTGIVDFASLADRLAPDQHGNTIVDLGAGNYIRLTDIEPASIDQSYFAFFDPGQYS